MLTPSYKFLTLLGVLVLSVILYRCSLEDTPVAATQDDISVPTDTLDLGTIFSEITTKTLKFKISNSSSSDVEIDTLRLKKYHRFATMIIDGKVYNSTSAIDVVISAGHDIWVFITLNLPYNQVGQDEIYDAFELISNNVGLYEIPLRGIIHNSIPIHNKDLFVSTKRTLRQDKKYFISGEIKVTDTLIIESGVRCFFTHQGGISIQPGGVLRVEGSLQDPIHLISTETEQKPGQWQGIKVEEGVKEVAIDYAIISGAVNTIDTKSNVSLTNTQIFETLQSAIRVENTTIRASNIVVSTALHAIVNLNGKVDVSFEHCTFVNLSTNPRISACINSDNGQDIDQASSLYFGNTVIAGKLRNEFNEGILPSRSILKMEGCFVSYKTEDLFFQIFSLNNILNSNPPIFINIDLYNLRVFSAASVLAGAGMPEVAKRTPKDLDGKDRTLASKPDIGAYQL